MSTRLPKIRWMGKTCCFSLRRRKQFHSDMQCCNQNWYFAASIKHFVWNSTAFYQWKFGGFNQLKFKLYTKPREERWNVVRGEDATESVCYRNAIARIMCNLKPFWRNEREYIKCVFCVNIWQFTMNSTYNRMGPREPKATATSEIIAK